jgi:hypothetical protein
VAVDSSIYDPGVECVRAAAPSPLVSLSKINLCWKLTVYSVLFVFFCNI